VRQRVEWSDWRKVSGCGCILSAISAPMLAKKELKALAMSVGSVMIEL